MSEPAATGVSGYLLDENLPGHLRLKTALPVLAAVTELEPSASDTTLWGFARERDLCIVTKKGDS